MRVISTRNAPKNRSPRTLLAASGALAVLAIAVTGCGGGVPSNSVAKVGDELITKKEFNHWLNAAAKGQAQQTGSTAAVSIPDPPDFKKCIAAKQKTPVPKGTPKPKEADLKKQCSQEFDALKTQVMQFLISAEWIQQEADKRGIKVSDKEVQTEFNDQKKQSFPKEADYQKFLKSSGQTEADLLFRVKLDVLSNKVREKVVAGKDKVSDAEIQAYYNKNKSRFAQPETRDLNVVLTEKEPEAKKALAELKSGKSFKEVSKKYSIDQASKSQGGKLPGRRQGPAGEGARRRGLQRRQGQDRRPGQDAVRLLRLPGQQDHGGHAAVARGLQGVDPGPAEVGEAAEGPGRVRQGLPEELHEEDRLRRRLQGRAVQERQEGPDDDGRSGAAGAAPGAAPQGAAPQGQPAPGQPQTAPQTPQTSTAPTTTP